MNAYKCHRNFFESSKKNQVNKSHIQREEKIFYYITLLCNKDCLFKKIQFVNVRTKICVQMGRFKMVGQARNCPIHFV